MTDDQLMDYSSFMDLSVIEFYQLCSESSFAEVNDYRMALKIGKSELVFELNEQVKLFRELPQEEKEEDKFLQKIINIATLTSSIISKIEIAENFLQKK